MAIIAGVRGAQRSPPRGRTIEFAPAWHFRFLTQFSRENARLGDYPAFGLMARRIRRQPATKPKPIPPRICELGSGAGVAVSVISVRIPIRSILLLTIKSSVLVPGTNPVE